MGVQPSTTLRRTRATQREVIPSQRATRRAFVPIASELVLLYSWPPLFWKLGERGEVVYFQSSHRDNSYTRLRIKQEATPTG